MTADNDLSDFFYKKLPPSVAPVPVTKAKAPPPAEPPADDEGYSDYFYNNLPASAGVSMAQSFSRDHFNDIAKNQDANIDKIAEWLPEHPDVILARELVNAPNLIGVITTGIAAQHFAETMPARTFGFMIAASLVESAENRSDIIVGHGFDRNVTAIASQLVSLKSTRTAEEDAAIAYEKYSSSAQRLFIVSLQTQLKMVYGSKEPIEMDLERVAQLVLRHTNLYGPYDETRSDRGEMKMLNGVKNDYNLLARKQGSPHRLSWNSIGVMVRSEWTPPRNRPKPE